MKETPEVIEAQIVAQVEKFEEIDRRLKTFFQTKAYAAWQKSPSKNLMVRLTLWPGTAKTESNVNYLEKGADQPEWSSNTEEEFRRFRGM